VQALLQQTPSTQKPLVHSPLTVHGVPFVNSAHAPDPLQLAAPPHSLSGSVVAAMNEQVPSGPLPFFALVHALQALVHAVLQQTPSTQKLLRHSDAAVHAAPFGSLHAPEPLHTSAPLHSLSGSWPLAMLPQVPSAPENFFAAVHAWHGRLHTLVQQTPSVQKPLAHSVPWLHGAPVPSSAHDVLPLQLAAPAHSLSGSVPTMMLPQVPSVPWPFFAAEHAWHVLVQALLQQKPSAQKPLVHSEEMVQGEPGPSRAHAGVGLAPLQVALPAHSLSGSVVAAIGPH
jgi:hypothetical protein